MLSLHNLAWPGKYVSLRGSLRSDVPDTGRQFRVRLVLLIWRDGLLFYSLETLFIRQVRSILG